MVCGGGGGDGCGGGVMGCGTYIEGGEGGGGEGRRSILIQALCSACVSH